MVDFYPLFLFVDWVFKYCTTADSVHSKERILELVSVVSFGVGKINIALILGYNGCDAHLLTIQRRCQQKAQHLNKSICLGQAIFAVQSKQHKALENQKLMHYGNYIYIRYQYYLFNIDSFFVVLYIAVCLVVRLFWNISSLGPGTVSAYVHIFWEF